MRTLAELNPGDTAIIKEIAVDIDAVIFLEMGLIPGEKVKYHYTAPMKDPLLVSIREKFLSIRKEDARQIIID